MVNRNKGTDAVRQTGSKTAPGRASIFDSSTASLAPNRGHANLQQATDDVIVSLMDSYENRRARQVMEWVRQQSVRRSA